MQGIRDKIVIITGGSRGIGWACANIFAQHGAKVIITGHTNHEEIKSKAIELAKKYKIQSAGFICDVSKLESVKKFYQQFYKQFKGLDILINNAGIMKNAMLSMCSKQHIDDVIDVNLKGAIYNLQFSSKLMMRNKRGSIINISSIIGLRGSVGQSVYGASKAALIGLTMSTAKELGSFNIRVNAICPGFIETDLTSDFSSDQKEDIRQTVSLQRLGQPKDIAKAVLFLASDHSSYITGQVLSVDGGMII